VRDILETSRKRQKDAGDPGQLIIGEWGVHMLDDTPADIGVLYSDIRQNSFAEKYWPDMMFYFSHNDTTDGGGLWGLRWSTFETEELPYFNGFKLNAYRVDEYNSSTESQRAKALRNAYSTIMGGTPL
jgi:hypothetical protein